MIYCPCRGGDQRRDDLYACKFALKLKVSSIIFLQTSVFLLNEWRSVEESGWRLIFLWRAFILFLQPAFAAVIFVSIFFSVKGAPMRDTCQTTLIEERFEEFSTVRYSYLAESTASLVPVEIKYTQHFVMERNWDLKRNSMQSSEAVLALNLSDSCDENLGTLLWRRSSRTKIWTKSTPHAMDNHWPNFWVQTFTSFGSKRCLALGHASRLWSPSLYERVSGQYRLIHGRTAKPWGHVSEPVLPADERVFEYEGSPIGGASGELRLEFYEALVAYRSTVQSTV